MKKVTIVAAAGLVLASAAAYARCIKAPAGERRCTRATAIRRHGAKCIVAAWTAGACMGA